MSNIKNKKLVDKLYVLFNDSITWGVIALIVAVLASVGMLSINLSIILFVLAFFIGCIGIIHIRVSIHLKIIFCFLLFIFLSISSWFIIQNRQKIESEKTIKPPSFYTIADCTFDIIFQISDKDLEVLKSSKQDISNGTIFAQVDIFEKDSPFRFIQLSIMGTWHNTDSRIFDSVEDLTLFSLRTKQFMFSRKKATIGNAQSGMTKLSSHRKYNIQIRGSIVENGNIIILTPTSATIQTHEGIVFPAIEFKRMENNEYWQAEFPSIPIQYLISD